MSEATATPTTPTATRRKSSKARRDLQTTIAQIDTLFPALADKPSKQADILCEKASLVKTLMSLEAEDRETEQGIRIKELEQQHATVSHRIAEFERENARLQVTASTPRIERIPDPEHATIKVDRDALQGVVTVLASLVAGLNEEKRAETAVRVVQSCGASQRVIDFCKAVGVDFYSVQAYLNYSEINLRRLSTAKDFHGVIVRAVLAVKYPAPAKPQAPAVFIPDLRTAEEKLRDAKASVRSGL